MEALLVVELDTMHDSDMLPFKKHADQIMELHVDHRDAHFLG
jgi:hypothetical protein